MKRKRKENGLYKALFISMIVFSGILVLTNIVVLGIIPIFFNKIFTYEQAAIQNIISVFTMAVSVWIGLSITERVDRGAILQLKEQAKEIEEQLAENERISLQLLLNDLRVNETDVIAQLVIQRIHGIATNIFPSGVWLALREEEQILNELRKMGLGKNFERTYHRYAGCVENIRKMIEKNKNAEEVKSINEILDFRMIEVSFLMGYSTDEKTANSSFVECVEFFMERSKQFGLDISDIPDKYVLKRDEAEELLDSKLLHVKYEWGVYAYLFNFIGESYSEIVHYNNRCKDDNKAYPWRRSHEKCKNLALNYCLLAIVSAERGKAKSEVYYRNYGCAIERANYFNLTEDILWEAMEQYKKAFQISSGQRLIYYCIASACNKIFEERTGLKRRLEEENMAERQLNKYNPKKMNSFFNEYGQWIHLYTVCFPTEISTHSMAVLYYRNRYLYYGRETDNVNNLGFHLHVMGEMNPDIKKRDEYRQGIEICKKERGLWNKREN